MGKSGKPKRQQTEKQKEALEKAQAKRQWPSNVLKSKKMQKLYEIEIAQKK